MKLFRMISELNPSRLKRWGWALVGLVIVATILFIYLRPIKKVEIYATFNHISRADLRRVIKPYASQGFFRVNLKQLQSQLKHNQWIKTAIIQRIWPATLKLTLQEYQPLVIWNDRDLLAANNQRLAAKTAVYPMLPKLYGKESERLALLTVYKQLQKPLSSMHVQVHMLLAQHQHIKCVLSNGLVLLFNKDNLAVQLNRLVKSYPIVATKVNLIRYIDLAGANGFAIHWRVENH